MGDFITVGRFMLDRVVDLLNSFQIPGLGFTPWQFLLLAFTVVIVRFFYGMYTK